MFYVFNPSKLIFAIHTWVFGCLILASTILPFAAGHAEDTLLLGMLPRHNPIETTRMYLPLAKYLSKHLGRKVQLVTPKNFPTFWRNVTNKQFDIVNFNQFHYVKSHKEIGYDVFGVIEEFGESTITGSIIVRKDSGINTVQDLKGKHIIFGGGKKAMQSYIYATYLLMEQGLNPGDYTHSIARTPPNAIFATYFKQASAGGIGDKVLSLPAVTQKIDTTQIRFLVKGNQYPHLPWAFNNRLPQSLQQQIAELMFNLKNTTEGKKILAKANLTGFVKATDQDFDMHRAIIYKVRGEQY